MKITTLVNGTLANFSYYRNGSLFYTINKDGDEFEFPIHLDGEDTEEVSFVTQHKAINLMRWIRKAMDKNELDQVKWKHMEVTNT